MQKSVYHYGYNPSDLDKRIITPREVHRDWGNICTIVGDEVYIFNKFCIVVKRLCSLDFIAQEAVFYVESGTVNATVYYEQKQLFNGELSSKETLFVPEKYSVRIEAQCHSCLYVFAGKISSDEMLLKKSETFDRREKPWAENLIETIVNTHYTGKRIFFKKGNSSSLHFHCKKTETYYIHSGKLLLRLRAGQGEDRFFTLAPGQAVTIPPGLMHQAGALEDVVIIEASTHDEDSDSFIVEAETAKMPRLKEMMS